MWSQIRAQISHVTVKCGHGSDLIAEVSLQAKLRTKSRSQQPWRSLWLLDVMKVCSTSILEIICPRCRSCDCWNLLMWSPHPIENIIFKHVSYLCSDTLLQAWWPSVRLTDVLSLRCRSFAVQSDRRWRLWTPVAAFDLCFTLMLELHNILFHCLQPLGYWGSVWDAKWHSWI